MREWLEHWRIASDWLVGIGTVLLGILAVLHRGLSAGGIVRSHR